ncbi:hypothetical protein Hanom_Chr03g00200941 [Helianthus anomalus]
MVISVADFALQDRQSLVVCLVPLHQRWAMIVVKSVRAFVKQRMSRMSGSEKHGKFLTLIWFNICSSFNVFTFRA